eukprot:CAMPEP_0185761624 /NCGR_PEP_ID=MMETSP1174-20130828/20573_1 /TAXON_ID=35687 /ORGANISM="Dictyocha speculum, Strain CCMP1381" /LENGTH=154 /DNA_ID=CAMNT_0028442947 /DNA_START=661 /DNA_END=1121 /DNA_ORIENTATION=-
MVVGKQHHVDMVCDKQRMPGVREAPLQAIPVGGGEQWSVDGNDDPWGQRAVQQTHVPLEKSELGGGLVLRREYDEVHRAVVEGVPHERGRFEVRKPLVCGDSALATTVGAISSSERISAAIVNLVVPHADHPGHAGGERLNHVKVALPDPWPSP